MSRCKPGDLAVVVEAIVQSNAGYMVRVVALLDGKRPLAMIRQCLVWMVKTANPLT